MNEVANNLCFSINLDEEETRLVEYNGLFYVRHGTLDEGIWKALYVGDHVLLACNSKKRVYRASVRDKLLIRDSKDHNSQPRPLAIEFLVHDSTERPILTFLSQLKRWERINWADYNAPFSKPLDPTVTDGEEMHQTFVHRDGDYSVYLAKADADFAFIESLSVYHSFGLRSALLSLVVTHNGQRVGAVVLDVAPIDHPTHRLAMLRFGMDYHRLRKHAVFIHRLYNSRPVRDKIKLHNVLVDAAIVVGHIFFGDQLTLVEGVSYDYHPVAERMGINVETPHREHDSFYFWKPFNETALRYRASTPMDVLKKRVHKIIRERGRCDHWVVVGDPNWIQQGIRMRQWRLEKGSNNNGRWAKLRKNAVVYFMDNRTYALLAYGMVQDKRLELDNRNFPRYPLAIYFSEVTAAPSPIQLDQSDFEKMYAPYRGGILPVISKIGLKLKEIVDNTKNEKRMWIDPNPYLLQHTRFTVVPKQVFLIQAFSLFDRLNSVIKEVLAKGGYSMTYFTDRNGQVVFNDIWTLMNESEAVVVDFTEKKPNVYLEYGMALVLGKPIVAISQNHSDLPSDTPNLKYILYKDLMGDATLEKRLVPALERTIKDFQGLNSQKRVFDLDE